MKAHIARCSLACLVSLLVCLFPHDGEAYIPLEISPELTAGGGYDDNVTLRTDRREGGYVAMVQPRVTLAMPFRRIDMSVDQSYYYYYNGKQGDHEAYQIQGKASMHIIKGLLLSISDKYLLVPVEVGRPDYSPANLTKANELDVGAVFDYDLTPRMSSEWKYDFVRSDFYDVFRATYYSHKAGVRVKQDLMDALSLYLEYTFLSQVYTLGGTNSLLIHEGSTGLNFVFHDLTGEAAIGLQSIDSGADGGKNGTVYKANLQYPATEKLEAKVSYSQTVGEEIRLKTYDAKTADAGLAFSIGPRTLVTALGKWGTYTFFQFPLSRRFWGTQVGLAYEIFPESPLTITYDHYEGKDNEGIVSDNRYFVNLRWVFR